MVQRLEREGQPPTQREWHMRRIAPGRFQATAGDMVGTATGEAAGRAFAWRWTLATAPGNPLLNVSMRQWMYAQDDGSVLIRTIISKLELSWPKSPSSSGTRTDTLLQSARYCRDRRAPLKRSANEPEPFPPAAFQRRRSHRRCRDRSP